MVVYVCYGIVVLFDVYLMLLFGVVEGGVWIVFGDCFGCLVVFCFVVWLEVEVIVVCLFVVFNVFYVGGYIFECYVVFMVGIYVV